ncbi:DUF6538 domain-containing protein [Aureimonas sp. AU40]|uniref:DUF6538 domain-containing protein n=1 Tax=Aureimonas sp. AU40 TaxID=1637747 RepID=UPI000781DD47|nr:DUF6538 domain-containing protein [Aureimonas sp. AU40]
MARAAPADTRYLENKDGKWRVVVSVPRALHPEMGTKLKRSLNTDSLAVANRLKWQVVAEFKAAIEAALKRGGKDPLAREALAIAAMRLRAQTVEDFAHLDDALALRVEEIAGRPLREEHHPGGVVEVVYDPQREQDAKLFAQMATGAATPLGHFHSDYLKHQTVKPRTRADDERALKYLEQWCAQNRVPPTVQAITRKVAVRFMDGMGSVTEGQSPVTLQKYLNRLGRYWKWMVHREHAETNVWQGLKLPKPKAAHNELERPFSKAEMLTLLGGPASPEMQDLMRIAALTGARLDVIVDLKVGDCVDGVFLFKPQKKETAVRAVPIHSALQGIVKRRTEGKGTVADLFPEWPAPKSSTSLRERSFKASGAFTDYRRSVGVDEQIDGKRRSLVNFHSFRRWFITEAERAGQPEHIIAAVVGHKRQGMTLGRYSAGPLLEQARQCVESVKLAG